MGLQPGDLWLLFDGGRQGHQHFFNNKLFVNDDGDAMPKTMRTVRIEYLEPECRMCMGGPKANHIQNITRWIKI